MKIIKTFRVDKEVWEKFKKTTLKPTKELRDFVEWNIKYNSLWYYVKNFLSKRPVCLLCGDKFGTVDLDSVSPKEYRKVLEEECWKSLDNGFMPVIFVRKEYSQLLGLRFEGEVYWVCRECFESLVKKFYERERQVE